MDYIIEPRTFSKKMKVIFTERVYDIFTRFIEMKYMHFVKEGAKDTAKDIELGHIPDSKEHHTTILTNYFRVEVFTWPIEHKQKCRSYTDNPDGHENVVPDGHCDECLRCGGQKVQFTLYYCPDGSSDRDARIRLGAFSVRSNKLMPESGNKVIPQTWEDCFEQMAHNFPANCEYNICDCGRLCAEICQEPPSSNPEQYDKCQDCYIYSYTRTEEEGGDCCVCMQNGGRWVKLGCNHILHKVCWNKIIKYKCKDKCPMCRVNTEVSEYYPY